MKQHIRVFIDDEKGLGESLMKGGVSQDRIIEAKRLIREQFDKSVRRVFGDILEAPIIPVVVVDLDIDTPQKKGRETLARFTGIWKDVSFINISVYKPFVVSVLNKGRNEYLKKAIFHELIHAADQMMINQSKTLIDDIQYHRGQYGDKSTWETNEDTNEALCDILRVYAHMRNEGVAILGEKLLNKSKFKNVIDCLEDFKGVYTWTKKLSRRWSHGQKEYGSAFNDDFFYKTYDFAPTIMAFVLERKGLITKDIITKILNGFETGCYDLKEEEIKSIIKSALSLNITDYIQEVTYMGDKLDMGKMFLDLYLTES